MCACVRVMSRSSATFSKAPLGNRPAATKIWWPTSSPAGTDGVRPRGPNSICSSLVRGGSSESSGFVAPTDYREEPWKKGPQVLLLFRSRNQGTKTKINKFTKLRQMPFLRIQCFVCDCPQCAFHQQLNNETHTYSVFTSKTEKTHRAQLGYTINFLRLFWIHGFVGGVLTVNGPWPFQFGSRWVIGFRFPDRLPRGAFPPSVVVIQITKSRKTQNKN
jgi:hypothetical protein